ncbi:hypothetical protein SKAU_G00143980 [Synaphobranchus kaupii]|uniref:Uncharacterized protein n=1 Tax=Synaphobranchus kaupii TaxID=118154 RepID=A0A9Q1J2E9_SYNKA|nr:hypothetical protein SKAU_G00143980 [Synaphobranchus kaupii]
MGQTCLTRFSFEMYADTDKIRTETLVNRKVYLPSLSAGAADVVMLTSISGGSSSDKYEWCVPPLTPLLGQSRLTEEERIRAPTQRVWPHTHSPQLVWNCAWDGGNAISYKGRIVSRSVWRAETVSQESLVNLEICDCNSSLAGARGVRTAPPPGERPRGRPDRVSPPDASRCIACRGACVSGDVSTETTVPREPSATSAFRGEDQRRVCRVWSPLREKDVRVTFPSSSVQTLFDFVEREPVSPVQNLDFLPRLVMLKET